MHTSKFIKRVDLTLYPYHKKKSTIKQANKWKSKETQGSFGRGFIHIYDNGDDFMAVYTVCLKYVHFFVYQLYLNESV